MNKKGAHVAIIGGGCAGLSAAATLIENGVQVTLFEASSQLGGRARTVAVENNSLMSLLDNGQHIMLGAYRETLGLLRKAGVDEQEVLARIPLQINMQTTNGKSVFFLKSMHYLPAPLNLLFGLLFCKGLSFSERMDAIKLVYRLKSTQYLLIGDVPLEQYLINQKQSVKLIEMLWEPLCLAALNTPIEVASTRVFLNVLKDTFSGSKKNSDFLLPRLDLSQVISQPLAHYIQARDGAIRLNKRIRSITTNNGGFALETRDGTYHFSHVVVATSPARVDKLLAQLPKLKRTLEQIETYTYQPIYTVYLQYPNNTKLPAMIEGLTGTLGQWIFDRGQLCGQHGMMAVIVSAEGKHQKLTQDQLALDVVKELHQAYPQLRKPLWYKVIAEKRATFSCLPDMVRPSNTTAEPRLYLAGDYTYADYPATIEGAVRSGIKCAKLILNE